MSTAEPPSDPLIGRTFSQYEIVAKLGGGGMGVVYQARDTRLGRTVALKFLPSQWSHDDGAKQRFMREAQAASATNHRNICVVHNIEETPDGRLFIVMAHYEGQTLKHRLESGPLSIADATDIATEVAEGLAKAHSQGVVHRDVKPANLMVTDDGVKILDFGLAKFADALALTAPGSTIGTYAYMSPEQARGEDADERSDVWALGVVMFEMLTGAPPFRGAYPEATFHAIKFEPVPSLRKARPDVPEPLERVVNKALEKDSTARYQTAREMARDLRAIAGRSVPLELRTESLPELADRRARELAATSRRRRWPLVSAVALIVLAAVAGGWFWWASRPVVRTSVAIAAVANHTGVTGLDRYRLALTESLIDELIGSPHLRVVSFQRTLEMIRPFTSGRADFAGSDAVHAVSSASGAPFVVIPTLAYRDRDASWLMQVQIRNADTGTTVATYETAPVNSTLSEPTAFRLVVAAAAQIQEHFRAIAGGPPPVERSPASRFQDPEAARLFTDGLDGYEQLEFNSALAAFRQSAERDPQHALTHAWVSRVQWLLGARPEAAVSAERASQLIDDQTLPVDAAFVKAVATEARGDAAEAERAYTALAAVDPQSLWGQVELADFLKRRQDRNQPAIEAYHAVLNRDPGFMRPHIELCQLYTRIDDHPLSLREAQTALERSRAAGARSGEAQALLCLAEEQRKQAGQALADARTNVGRAKELFEQLDQPYNLARAHFYSGLVEYSDGRLPEASDRFREAAERLGANNNRALQGVALMNLGAINFQLGQPTPALEFFRRGRDVFQTMGDERRAAEADVNAGGVQVEFGVDPADTQRLAVNARATLERLGYTAFELLATRNEAEGHRYAGRLTRARTLLQSAFERARSRGLTASVDNLALALAQADLEDANYREAKASLETLASNDGPAALEARIALAATLGRLGEFEPARAAVRQALTEIERRQYFGLKPMAYLAAGQLAWDSNDRDGARQQFDLAIASWSDPLPNAYATEARCARGVESALRGRFDAARADLEAGIVQSARVGRLSVQTRCRVGLVRLLLQQKNGAQALKVFGDIPEDSAGATLGRELRAEVEYWRAEAAAAARSGDGAEARRRAQQLLEAIQAPWSTDERARYAARAEIQRIMAQR